jgi:hypothetical protein
MSPFHHFPDVESRMETEKRNRVRQAEAAVRFPTGVAGTGVTLPRILIMSSYNLTTASSQTQRAREQKAMYEDVARYNSARTRIREPNVQLVNVIDGAGWLARANDLRQMHEHCDYALAFRQLDRLPDILHYHMRQVAN